MKNCEVIRGIGESPIQTATQLNNCFFSKIRKEKGEVMRRIGENQMQKKKKIVDDLHPLHVLPIQYDAQVDGRRPCDVGKTVAF